MIFITHIDGLQEISEWNFGLDLDIVLSLDFLGTLGYMRLISPSFDEFSWLIHLFSLHGCISLLMDQHANG